MYDKERVGRRLASLRTDKGWSQDELACEAKVSRDTVASIEAARNGMSLDTAFKLTEALDCTLETLACREEGGRW